MLVTLFLATTLSCQACAGCGLVNDKVRLCTSHAEAERLAISGAKKQLSSKLETERIAALEALSGLTRSHVNAPSEKVALLIAGGLDDESSEVRERAAHLLGPPQHAIVSMDALLDTLSAAEKELERLLNEKEGLQKKKWMSNVPDKRKEALEDDLRLNERKRMSLLSWRRIVLDRLGLFPDERVVAALCEHVRPLVAAPAKARDIEDIWDKVTALRIADENLPAAMDVNATLVRLGNREALLTMIANLTVLQTEIAEFEQWDSFPYIAEPILRGLTEARNRSQEGITAALVDQRRGLPDPCPFPTLLDWLRQNIELFPEHMPGMVSPAW